MTINAEEAARVTQRRFRGLNRGVEPTDVPMDQFRDAINVITDVQIGEVRTRDGFLPVTTYPYPNAFSILPGVHGTTGLIYRTPEPPPAGALTLTAYPTDVRPTSGAPVTVTFVVSGGATLAASPVYYWDFDWPFGGTAASDENGASTSTTHAYAVTDAGTRYCRVWMTGDDSVVYYSWVKLDITDATIPLPSMYPADPPARVGGTSSSSGSTPGGGEEDIDPPTVEIEIVPPAIATGASADVVWRSTNADTCELLPPGGPAVAAPVSGRIRVTPAAAGSYTYSVTVENDVGSDTAAAVLVVTGEGPANPVLEYQTYQIEAEVVPGTVASAQAFSIVARCYQVTKYVGQPATREACDFPVTPQFLLTTGVSSRLDIGSMTTTDAVNVYTWGAINYTLASGDDEEGIAFLVYLNNDVKMIAPATVIGGHILAEIVDENGDAITVADMDWTDGYAEFYVRLTAKDTGGSTETTFDGDVLLKLLGTSGSWSDPGDIDFYIIAYDENDVFDAETAVDAAVFNEVLIPAATWLAGDAGIVSAKVNAIRYVQEATITDPSENPNGGYVTVQAWGEEQ